MSDADLDSAVWGGVDIAKLANLFKDDGTPDDRKAYYLLERGLLDGTKLGRLWVSTPRRIRKAFAGDTAA